MLVLLLLAHLFLNVECQNRTEVVSSADNSTLLEELTTVENTTEAVISRVCEPAIPCIEDDDCFGGLCFGFAIGKCNCGACIPMVRCNDDEPCGGLIGACIDGYCDCGLGFRKNGLRSSLHAYNIFCNIKECNPRNPLESCFGLPCNPGVCICPRQKN